MIKPLAGYLLIEPIEEERTEGGFVLPEKAKEKPEKGKIISICDFYMTEPLTVVAINKEKQKEINEFWKKDPTTANSLVSMTFEDLKVGSKVIFHRWSGQDVKEGSKEYKLVKFSDIMATYE